MYTGESDFPRLVPPDLELCVTQVGGVTACFAVFIGHCHTCVRQQASALIGLSIIIKKNPTKSILFTLIWERKAYRRCLLLSIFLLHYELQLPAFISSHNLLDATALSPVQFEWILSWWFLAEDRVWIRLIGWNLVSISHTDVHLLRACECTHLFSLSLELISRERLIWWPEYLSVLRLLA